jgi:lipopolysaccharide/colanic/teichoic acid biosynthesis glycosyltransferase
MGVETESRTRSEIPGRRLSAEARAVRGLEGGHGFGARIADAPAPAAEIRPNVPSRRAGDGAGARSSRGAKRAFDLLGASLGLLAVLPLVAAIAVAIRLEGGGPVLFGQLRVGRHGRRFRMLKFRTMVPDAESLKDSLRHLNEARGGLFKIADDPRVTRVGRLLRKSALDELPQLLNVIKGEMSLVGPRPLVIDEDRRIEGWRRRRLDLMPGMTGPWQILGPARVPLWEMAVIDYLYVANWSLWSDIKILLRTVPHVLGRRGL